MADLSSRYVPGVLPLPAAAGVCPTLWRPVTINPLSKVPRNPPMFFSPRLSLSSLQNLCIGLRQALGAGLGVREVFKQQAERGRPSVRPAASRIFRRLDRGDSLEDALADEHKAFPPLFITMAAVGEQTGHLPETFRELERYFQMQVKLRRQFLGQTFPSALQ